MCLRLVLDGFTRHEFDEAPPWQVGLRFWKLSLRDQSVAVDTRNLRMALAGRHPQGCDEREPPGNWVCAIFAAGSWPVILLS